MKSKSFCAVSEKIKELYTSKIFFLEFILWIRRMLFWQLWWELLGKSLKLSLLKTINDSEYLFLQKLFPQKFLPDTFPPKFWDFFPESPQVLNAFSPKHFFNKMLAWTGRMHLWYCLRHFSPESWKSSAQIQKLIEKKDCKLKVFSSKSSSGHTECSFS